MLEAPLSARQRINKQIIGAIKPTPSALDIGPGIRPFTWIEHEHFVCIEPHGEYCDILRKEGFKCVQDTALDYLNEGPACDTIYFIDVIEHMDKEEGRKVIDLAKEIATTQVIIFTPLGYMVQDCDGEDTDPWDMQGQKWQTHRSGWLTEEFLDWQIFRDNSYHGRKKGGAFAAIWNNS